MPEPDPNNQNTNDNPPANDPPANDPPKPETVALTQDQIQKMIDKAYERGARNSADARKLQELEAELGELRTFKTKVEQLKPGEGEEDLSKEQLAKLREQITAEYQTKFDELKAQSERDRAQHDTTVAELLRKDLERQVIASAAKGGAKDATDVFTLMEASGIFDLDEDTGAWVVKDPKTGKVRLDVENNAEPLGVDKAVVEFLDAKPHLKRSSGRTGSGQGTGGDQSTNQPSGDVDFGKMTASEMYQKKDEILRKLGHTPRGG
jgi:hypothetical protein